MATPPVPLVLLPGMDGTEILFGPLLAHLPPSLAPHVVTYPSTGPNGYDDVYPLVHAAVAAHPGCIVLGWSFSGPLAVRVAAALPTHVRGVVLAASFVQAPMAWLRWTGPLLQPSTVIAARVLRRLPLWLGRPAHDPLRRDKARIWQRVPGRTLAARARAIRTVDASTQLQQVRQPLLYLAGADDRVVRPHNLATIRRLRPDTQVATLPGGHFALYSAAPAAAVQLAEFAAATAAREA